MLKEGSLGKVIAVLGGIAVDLEARPYKKLLMKDSNPGHLEIACGGVGRNIAENLQRMGDLHVLFFSAVGEDVYAEKALQSIASIGVDTTFVCRLPQFNTATYLSILDENGDMALAVAAMDIFDQISLDMLKKVASAFDMVDFIVLDANLSKDVLEYAAERFKNQRIFLEPVSVEKAGKASDILNRCHTIKPNKAEAEILSGVKIRTEADLEKAGEALLGKGVKRVFISLGEQGVFYMDKMGSGKVPPPEKLKPVSTTGAGDAMSAAIVRSTVMGRDMDRIARDAVLAASRTLQVESAVNENIGNDFE